MEVSSVLGSITNTGNITDQLFANEITRNLANATKKNEVLECGVELKDGLFEFIVSGVLLNLVSLFGILGNTISMIILSRPQMKSSINYLLIGLARCDTILITIAVRNFNACISKLWKITQACDLQKLQKANLIDFSRLKTIWVQNFFSTTGFKVIRGKIVKKWLFCPI